MPPSAAPERERLERIARGGYSSHEGFDAQLVRYGIERLRPHLGGARCLELGAADGAMTEHLLDLYGEVVSVDGSPTMCARLEERFGARRGFRAFCALLEDVEPGAGFDAIVAAHILEHVDDPVAIVRRARAWGGRLMAVVPNACSLHRLMGVKMGLLATPEALGPNDLRLGHRRMYTAETLRADLEAGGWRVVAEGGTFLKPLANAQCEALLTAEQRDALFALGEDLPRLTSEVYAICEQ